MSVGNTYTEEQLLSLLLSGKEDNIRIVFDHYYDGLWLYAKSILRDTSAAEEIVEDLFISLWKQGKNLEIKSSLKHYLFRSIHNRCLNYLSRLKTEQKLKESMIYTLEDFNTLHPYSDDFIFSNLLVKEIEAKAKKILESLPEQCRRIYYLNRFENLRYGEIASQLNISIGTVKTQMSRAFKHFREELKEYLPLLIMLALFC